MSQPKRYKVETLNCCFDADMVESDTGEYVLHSEYAALAAENERLRQPWVKILTESENWKALSEIAQLRAEKEALVQQGIRDHGDWRSKLNFLEVDYKAEIARLRAENERLRKAGDAMADTRNKPTTLSEFGHLAMAWFAAKEGRDAK